MREMTFGEWLSEWYEIYKKPKIHAPGREVVERCMRLHVPEWLKAVPLSSLKVFEVDKAIAELPPSRTQKYVYDIIRASLQKAYKIELLPKDLSAMIEPARYKVKNGSALSEDEIYKFLERARGHKLESLFKFYVLTGVRRHEALTLLWEDIDFTRKSVLIRGTKTTGSLRRIPLSEEVEALLLSIDRKEKRVFPFNDDYITKTFKKFCPAHKLHDLRHTFATICAESNVHPTATQRLLGHSQITTTMKIYTHVQSAFVAQELKKFRFPINGENGSGK